MLVPLRTNIMKRTEAAEGEADRERTHSWVRGVADAGEARSTADVARATAAVAQKSSEGGGGADVGEGGVVDGSGADAGEGGVSDAAAAGTATARCSTAAAARQSRPKLPRASSVSRHFLRRPQSNLDTVADLGNPSWALLGHKTLLGCDFGSGKVLYSQP